LRNQFNWLPLLLFLTGFVTTVYMVNLLIAMMTSTYERIRSKSHDWRAMHRCDSLLEFKDERGAPPPLNLLLWPFTFMRKILFPKSLCPQLANWFDSFKSTRGFATPLGITATIRLQAREQRCARAFDQQSKRADDETTEARVASIFEDMPIVHALSRRCEALEEAIRAVHTLVEQQGETRGRATHRRKEVEPSREPSADERVDKQLLYGDSANTASDRTSGDAPHGSTRRKKKAESPPAAEQVQREALSQGSRERLALTGLAAQVSTQHCQHAMDESSDAPSADTAVRAGGRKRRTYTPFFTAATLSPSAAAPPSGPAHSIKIEEEAPDTASHRHRRGRVQRKPTDSEPQSEQRSGRLQTLQGKLQQDISYGLGQSRARK